MGDKSKTRERAQSNGDGVLERRPWGRSFMFRCIRHCLLYTSGACFIFDFYFYSLNIMFTLHRLNVYLYTNKTLVLNAEINTINKQKCICCTRTWTGTHGAPISKRLMFTKENFHSAQLFFPFLTRILELVSKKFINCYLSWRMISFWFRYL